jgi:type IV fimbrial biogenesis protein FimT
MTVVILIGILAVIAIPAASRAMRENRSSAAAQRVSLMYQTARARAIGRGAAMLVRYEDGVFEVREAVSADATSFMPISSCTVPTTRWTDPTLYDVLDKFQLVGQSPYELVKTEFASKTGADTEDVLGDGGIGEVCFTPNGTMLYRKGTTGAFTGGARTLMIRVGQQDTSGNAVGIPRTIFILPNGVARLAARAGG